MAVEEYFGHEHPLILREKEDPGDCFRCHVCSGFENMVGETSFYRCSDVLGCDFKLHKSCAELPRKIQHLVHPDHPLTLLPQLPHKNYNNDSCNCCGFVLYKVFTYHCSLCQFKLCVNCALPILLNLDYASHQHQPLIPLRETASLFCEACGTKHEGIFYTCPTCIANSHTQFFIHRNCALLPQTFRHSGHDDHHDGDLILGYSIPPEYTLHNQCCKICLERVNPKYWVYYCGGCRYFVHINCVTTTTSSDKEEEEKKKQTEPFMLILEPCDESTDDRVEKSLLEVIHLPLHESVSLLSHYSLKNMKLEDNQRANFNHFSHEHPLTFFDDQSEDEELCSGLSKLSLLNKINDDKICIVCIQRIWNSPFYSCAQCDVFLHKCCAELPTTVEAPWLCEHQLILVAKASTRFNLFLCECCDMYCNGFAYHCAICKFYIDVQCGLLPSAITHEVHDYPQHLLQLTTKGSKLVQFCSSCNVYFNKIVGYRCNMCTFFLDIRCALIPRTISQKYDELHPFTLCYDPIKDHPQEYICEVCERDLNPMSWFYHCVECDKSIHIDCTYLDEQFRNVKFGGTFHTAHHEHQLTLVHKTKKPSICNTCNGDIQCDYVFRADSTLECSHCNFKMHLECALKTKKSSVV